MKKAISKEKITLTITVGIACFSLVFIMSMQFKIVNQTDITAIENMRETELRTELANWKAKYEETDLKYQETQTKIEEYKQGLEEPVVDDIVEPETSEEIDTEVEECNDAFCACKDHVQQAIECLGDLATNGDERAKEAIANLSIVYFDLQ